MRCEHEARLNATLEVATNMEFIFAQELVDSSFWTTTVTPALRGIGIIVFLASFFNAAKKALADKSGGWAGDLIKGILIGSVIYGVGDLIGDGSLDLGGPGKAVIRFFWDFLGGTGGGSGASI